MNFIRLRLWENTAYKVSRLLLPIHNSIHISRNWSMHRKRREGSHELLFPPLHVVFPYPNISITFIKKIYVIIHPLKLKIKVSFIDLCMSFFKVWRGREMMIDEERSFTRSNKKQAIIKFIQKAELRYSFIRELVIVKAIQKGRLLIIPNPKRYKKQITQSGIDLGNNSWMNSYRLKNEEWICK